MSLLPTHAYPPPSNGRFYAFLSSKRRLCSGRTLLPLLIIGAISLLFLGPPIWPGHPPPPPLRLPPPSVFNKNIAPPFPPPPPPLRRPGYATAIAETSHTIWSDRAERVKDAFEFAWSTYRKFAFPHDEVMPLTTGKVDNFNGWGVTIYDALDTIWIMGLEDIWDDAMVVVASATFPQEEHDASPFFETVIRYLGGLLSAYSLSGDPILLHKAKDLGSRLLGVFNTTSGLPMYSVNVQTGIARGGWSPDVLYAEALSCQMEYKYLAHASANHEYYFAVEEVMNVMYNATVKDNAYPTKWSMRTGQPTNTQFSVGAFADSAHEYLLKQYLLSGRTEPKTRDFYLLTVQAIIDKLLYLTPNRHLLYATDAYEDSPTHLFEHLSCFLPGLLALGVHTLDLPPRDRDLHMWAAQGLAYTCYLTYADSATGLGPDVVSMAHDNKQDADGNHNPRAGRWVDALSQWEKEGRPSGIPPGLQEGPPMKNSTLRDYYTTQDGWFLRPEVIESLYYMWKTTGDVAWRERGWEIFQSIEKHARKDSGYASLKKVDVLPPVNKDESPSFFYAETLKYLYLMFHETDLIPLDEFVFNTEAHPLRIFQWTETEKAAFGLL